MQQRLKNLAARLGARPEGINYLVHADTDRRIAYFETPKVACTSIKKYMQDQVVGEVRTLPNKNVVHDRAHSPIAQLSQIDVAVAEAALLGDFRRFSFTRNPYTRILSGYLDKIVQNEWERARHLPRLGFPTDAQVSFAAFLSALSAIPDTRRDIHFMSQAALICAGDVAFDFLGAFESFDRDFRRLKSRFYHDASDDTYADFGTHHATGAADKIARYLGPDEIAVIRRLYAADFEIFGYATDVEAALEPPTRGEGLAPSNATLGKRLGLGAIEALEPQALTRMAEARVSEGSLAPEAAAELLMRVPEGQPGAAETRAAAQRWFEAAGFAGRAEAVRTRAAARWPDDARFTA